MRFAILSAAAACLFALAAAVAPTSPHGLPSASAGVASVAVDKPRIRYIFATIGQEATSVVVSASVDTRGSDTSYYVDYGPSAQYGSRTPTQTLPAKPRLGSGFPTIAEITIPVGDLAPDTRYHYRLVVTNAVASVSSKNRTVVSGGKAPRLSDAVVRSARTRTSVALAATIDTGGLATTARAECGPGYRSKSADVTLAPVPSPGSSAPSRRATRFNVNGVRPDKRSVCRIVASNAAGADALQRVVDGSRSHGVQFPSAVVGPTVGSAVLGAMVDTGGLPTTYYVEYGPNKTYASSTPKRSLRASPGKAWSKTTTEIRVPLSGLTPATTYSYRIAAVNAKGTKSATGSFVSGGSAPTISRPFAGPSTGTASARFGATIDTGGLPTTYYVEYGPTLSYGSQTATATLPALPTPQSFRPTVIEARSGEIVVTPRSRLHFRIVATNAAGTIRSSDHKYTARPS